jgi:transposase
MDFNLNNQAKEQRYTLRDFEKQFPNDDACLEWLKDYLFPNGITCAKCEKITKHYRVKSRKSYSCEFCGNHFHPTADTIFHKSATPLKLWFFGIFLMSGTRCGISAKQLERSLGVTYKTAWRMFHQIRSMLTNDPEQLTGSVEVDETYVGGKFKAGTRGVYRANKSIVVGAVERKGKVKAKIVPNTKTQSLMPFIWQNVEPKSNIYTDEHSSYHRLPKLGYHHEYVKHVSKVWVLGDAHTNTIEGFWSLLKGGIRGVYKHVDEKYLQNYINEYTFRYNRRFVPRPMFTAFVEQVQKDRKKGKGNLHANKGKAR